MDINCNYWRLDGFYSVANYNGIVVDSDFRNANNGYGSLIIVRDNLNDGFVAGMSTGNVIDSLNSSANTGNGIVFEDQARGWTVAGGNVERNLGYDIVFLPGSAGNTMENMRVDDYRDLGSSNRVTIGRDI